MLVGLEDLTQPMVKLNDFVGGNICIFDRKDQVLCLSKRCVSWFLAGVFFFFCVVCWVGMVLVYGPYSLE